MNETYQEGWANILYPDRKQYRTTIHQAIKYAKLNGPKEMAQYDEIAKDYETKGISYQKLLEPHAVFRHRVPRSLFSLLHLTIHDAPTNKR